MTQLGPQKVEDASLPHPWIAIFDPNSQKKYYWNPSTNVTTYDRPGPPAASMGGYGGAAPAGLPYQACQTVCA